MLHFFPQVSIHHYKATPYRYNVNKNCVRFLGKHNLKASPLESTSNQIVNSKPLSSRKFGDCFDLQNYLSVSLRLNAP